MMLNRLFGLSIIWCAALFSALLFMIFAASVGGLFICVTLAQCFGEFVALVHREKCVLHHPCSGKSACSTSNQFKARGVPGWFLSSLLRLSLKRYCPIQARCLRNSRRSETWYGVLVLG
jgi:hypothetical protein